MAGIKGWPKAQKLPFSKKSLSKRVMISYIFDYVVIVALLVVLYIIDRVDGFHQHFSLQNYTLQYPFATTERVPVKALVFIVVVAPAAIIAIYTLVIDGLFSHNAPAAPAGGKRRMLSGRYRMKDRLWELNCGLLGLMLSVGAAFTITGTLKNAIGKPRPDLIDRCRPLSGSVDPPMFGLSNSSICTQTDNHILQDGFRSFPSGHSSTAFAGLYYLSIYLAGKLHVLDSKGEVWKTFIVLVPTLGAALVAGSRIMDARHHPFDVISGSLLGILVAWGSYRQYFPPVTKPWCKGRAYPIRSWGKQSEGPSTLSESASVPLTGGLRPVDEEHANSPTGQEHNGNVFRQQVSATDLRRAQNTTGFQSAPIGHDTPKRFATNSSTYSQALGPNRNPYTASTRANDHYNESSSEDEYELQQTYTLSNPNRGAGIASSPYDNTAYSSQTAPQQLKEISGSRPPLKTVDSSDLGMARH